MSLGTIGDGGAGVGSAAGPAVDVVEICEFGGMELEVCTVLGLSWLFILP